MKDKLIDAGVRNLKEFGYPGVNRDNILNDLIYAQFFKGMLEDTLADSGGNVLISGACAELILAINQARKGD